MGDNLVHTIIIVAVYAIYTISETTSDTVLLVQGVCNTTQLYDPMHPRNSRTIPNVAHNFYKVQLPATVAVNERIYIMGGVDHADLVTDQVQIVDLWTNHTKRAASMLTGRIWHTANIIGSNEIIVCGGWDGATSIEKSCEIYSVTLNTWTYSDPMPFGIYGHTSAVLGQTLYVIGGADDRFVYNTVFTWNAIRGGDWTQKRHMNTPRWPTAALALPNENKILVCAGSFPFFVAVNSCEQYDVGTDTWQNLASHLQLPRWGLTLVQVNGLILAIGGNDNLFAYPVVEVLNRDKQLFTHLHPLPKLCSYWSSNGIVLR